MNSFVAFFSLCFPFFLIVSSVLEMNYKLDSNGPIIAFTKRLDSVKRVVLLKTAILTTCISWAPLGASVKL